MAADQTQIAAGLQNWAANTDPGAASGGFSASLKAQQNIPAPAKVSNNFFANLGHSIGAAFKASPSLLGNAAHAVFVEPFTKTAKGVADVLTSNQRIDAARRSSDVNAQLADTYIRSYRAGTISKDRLNTLMTEIGNDNAAISTELKTVQDNTSAAAGRDFAINAYVSILVPLTTFSGITSGAMLAETGTGVAAKLEPYLPRISSFITHTGDTVEQVATKFPTMSKWVNQTPEAQSIMKGSFNALIKNPIQVNLAVRQPIQVMSDAAQGKYGAAVVNAALIGLGAFEGGPIGVIKKLFGTASEKAGERAFGQAGFIDEMGKLLKDDPAKYLQYLKDTKDVKYAAALQAWKTFEGTNLDHFGGDVKNAVAFIAEWHAKHSNPLGNYSAAGLTDYWIDFDNTLRDVQKLAKAGKLTFDGEVVAAENAARVGLGKFGTEEKYALIKTLETLPDQQSRIAVIDQMIADGYGWAQNPNMRESMTAAVRGEGFAKDILKIKTGSMITVEGGAEFPRNYFPIFLKPNAKGYETTLLESVGKITHATEIGDILDRSVAPKKIAGAVGGFFERIGLSPRDRNATGYIALNRNIAQNLLESGIKFDTVARGRLTDSEYVLRELGNLADTKKSVFDLRQLNIGEIQSALKIDSKTAKGIKAAITQGYLDIPLQVRGLGNRIQDINSRFNPFAQKYSRIQSAGRYAFNPFFATQEIIESEALAQGLVGGKRLQLPGVNGIANLFGRNKQQLDDIVVTLDKGGFFSGTGRGEFADSGIVGISAHLRGNQKLTMAGMVDSLAKKAGMTTDDYLQQHGPEVADMMRVIVQYPRNSALNSPLMTTLNLVAFPTRYNIKLVKVAADVIGKRPAFEQVLILNSLMHAGQWLNSQEGKDWQARNIEAIGVFKYLTPLNSIAQVSKILTGKAESFSDYGALGGLPFGMVSQLLDHYGIININGAYINPRTGQAVPKYIPNSTKAYAKTALDDFLGSIFSYPGATVGLPSKSGTIRDYTAKLPGLKGAAKEYDKVQPTLSNQDRTYQEVVQRVNGTQTAKPTTSADPSNPFDRYNIPPPAKLKPLVKRPDTVLKSNPPAFAGVKPKQSRASRVKPVARPIQTN